MKASSHPASIVSLGRSPSSSDGEFVLEINKNGIVHFWDYSKSTGQGFSILGGSIVSDGGSRVHVAVSRNGRDCSIYVNGQPAAHSMSTASVVYQNTFLVFGMDYQNRSNYFKGTMDHVAIFSQSLSDSEIKSLYSSEVDAPSSIPTPAPSNSGSFQRQ
eukprot:gene35152-45506_t